MGGEEKRRCRICGSEEESWEHVWEECRSWGEGERRSWQEVFRSMLGDEGEGKGWMREVEEERRKRGEGSKDEWGLMRKVNEKEGRYRMCR